MSERVSSSGLRGKLLILTDRQVRIHELVKKMADAAGDQIRLDDADFDQIRANMERERQLLSDLPLPASTLREADEDEHMVGFAGSFEVAKRIAGRES